MQPLPVHISLNEMRELGRSECKSTRARGQGAHAPIEAQRGRRRNPAEAAAATQFSSRQSHEQDEQPAEA